MGRRAVGALVVVALFGASGCGSVERRERADDGPAPSVVVGRHLLDELPFTTEPTSPPQRRGAASFAMRLNDENDEHPAGVPVKVTGPVTRTIASDAGGYVKANVPPGIYRFNVVEGCHEAVIVHKGGGGQAGVVEGRTTTGTLLLLWQHRYGPAPPVYNDATGRVWPRGKPITFSYEVEDHCNQTAAPSRAISTYAYRLSSNLRLAKIPSLVADDEGRAHVSVACVSGGRVKLDVYDTQNPGDSNDLVQLAIGTDAVQGCGE